jgi:hypothetical protein
VEPAQWPSWPSPDGTEAGSRALNLIERAWALAPGRIDLIGEPGRSQAAVILFFLFLSFIYFL